jgi:hypothetical protein
MIGFPRPPTGATLQLTRHKHKRKAQGHDCRRFNEMKKLGISPSATNFQLSEWVRFSGIVQAKLGSKILPKSPQ